MTHLCIPVLEITDTGPLSLTIVCAELQCIVNNFTIESIDRRNSMFICHLHIILQVPGQHLLHLTCAYFERLFAMMQKPELTQQCKICDMPAVLQHTGSRFAKKAQKEILCSGKISEEGKAGSLPEYFLQRTACPCRACCP